MDKEANDIKIFEASDIVPVNQLKSFNSMDLKVLRIMIPLINVWEKIDKEVISGNLHKPDEELHIKVSAYIK